jgi:outer membrane protein assembly factor BamB
MSPLLEGDILIVHIGGHDRGSLVAFEAATGETRWSLDGDGPGYSSPIVVDAGGKRQVVTQTQTRVLGVEAASGNLIWSFPYKTLYDQNSVTPVAWGGRVVISGLDQGVQAIDPGKPPGSGAPPVLWRTADVSMYMSTPVVDRDALFGFSHKRRGEVFAMDTKGSVLWKSEGGLGENASLVVADGAIIALLNDAELIVFRPNRERFDVIARRKVATTPTWAHPLLRGNRLWVKDRTSLICWSLEAAGRR